MPIVSNMFVKATTLFDSDYYGYINSDILLTPNLFQYLELCRRNAERGNINKRVGVFKMADGSTKSPEEFRRSCVIVSSRRPRFLPT